MEPLTITKREAREFILAHQGLGGPYRWERKVGALEAVRHLGCIQFDPLDVVGRNPDLVLQARVAGYRPSMLEELLYEDRELVDGWDKNMAIYPVDDWPYFRRHREAMRNHPRRNQTEVQAVLPRVREALEKRGPLSSIDLKMDETVDWSWAPTRLARAALESMYSWGELIVHHKVHTRKVYDFAANHIPEEVLSAPDPNENEAAYHDWHVLRRIGGVGLLWDRAGSAWLGIRRFKSPERRAALERLLEQGRIAEVRVEGLKPRFYARSDDLGTLREAADDQARPRRATVVAPLDNVMWDRRLVEALFDFEYRWEVYKPAEERAYGYYVLPILLGDRFIARFEPERDEEQGVLRIKGWWWEDGVQVSDDVRAAVTACLGRFLDYLGLGAIGVERETMEAAGLDWLAEMGRT